MKILMVNKFLYQNGGSETYIFKLGEALQKKGHEVQYFGMEHKDRIVGNHEPYTQSLPVCRPFSHRHGQHRLQRASAES